jgi:preprotein translocase SecE subunit
MFHQWPQGRILRICVMVLAGIIAADIGYNGAYGSIDSWLAPEGARRQLILGIVYATLALAVAVAGLIAAGPHRRAVAFLISVQDEMTKVVWPKAGELWRSTLVIALAIAVIAGIVFLADLLLLGGLNVILKTGGTL